MDCPDCKGQVELEEVEHWIGNGEDDVDIEEKYYKCPKCKNEYPLEDIDG